MAFDARYAANYRRICGIAHAATRNFCCCCLFNKSEEIHHVCYSDQHGAIAGREIPGVHIFPVCKRCHELSHKPEVWVRDRANPALGNHNKAAWVTRLKMGYMVLSSQ